MKEIEPIIIESIITVKEVSPSVETSKADLRKKEPANAAVINLFITKIEKEKNGGSPSQEELAP